MKPLNLGLVCLDCLLILALESGLLGERRRMALLLQRLSCGASGSRPRRAGGSTIPRASWWSSSCSARPERLLQPQISPLAAAVFLAAVAVGEVLMLAWGQRGTA